MTAHVLVSGAIFRQPEQRTSKAGKPFWTVTIKAKGDDAVAWWKIVVFSESAGAELMRLSDGDALSVQGSLRVETYERDGITKISLTCIADAVLPLRAAPKEKKKREPAPAPARSEKPAPDRSSLNRHGDGGEDPFGDEVPF
jgi:single-stranded DNA-binding protein